MRAGFLACIKASASLPASRHLLPVSWARARLMRPLARSAMSLCARLQKSPAEVQCMRKSAQLSAHALQRCVAMTRPGVTEQALAATFGACATYFGARQPPARCARRPWPAAAPAHACYEEEQLSRYRCIPAQAGGCLVAAKAKCSWPSPSQPKARMRCPILMSVPDIHTYMLPSIH